MDYGRRRGAYFISIDKLRLTNYNGVSIVATLCLAYHLLFYRSLSGAKAKTMWSTERERITNLQICWTAVTTETATWPVVKLTEVMPRRYCTRHVIRVSCNRISLAFLQPAYSREHLCQATLLALWFRLFYVAHHASFNWSLSIVLRLF